MHWRTPESSWLVNRLEPPQKPIDIVLDTDTYNEVDDQFALAYSLLSPEKLSVKAVYAAPFYCNMPGICVNARSICPADGMTKSYNEITRLLGLMHRPVQNFAFKGSATFLSNENIPVESPAAQDLVARATAREADNPLYVVAIGAITNVASALIIQPEIAKKINVVWLGGNHLSFPTTCEFNLMQDVVAARVVLDSGVPLTLIPCFGVASHLLVSAVDMQTYLKGANTLCDALSELFCAYTDDHFIWAKEIWDVSAIAYLINPDWVPSALHNTPRLTDDYHWAQDSTRHLCRVAYIAYRNPIMKDLFIKLRAAEAYSDDMITPNL